MPLNAAQKMLARGTSTLAKKSPQSEAMTFDGSTVWVNCNRVQEDADPTGLRDVSTEEGSVIEYPLSGDDVETGDILTDSFGIQHSVKRVHHLGHALKLTCKVLRP